MQVVRSFHFEYRPHVDVALRYFCYTLNIIIPGTHVAKIAEKGKDAVNWLFNCLRHFKVNCHCKFIQAVKV